MADELVTVDDATKRFPDAVRSALAVDLTNPTTVEGAAVRAALDADDQPALNILRVGMGGSEFGPVNVVFAGSSTAAGNNANPPSFSVAWRVMRGLQTAAPSGWSRESDLLVLDDVYAAPPTTPGVIGMTAAIGGTNSTDYLTSTTRPRVAAVNPVAVFHFVGSNDYASNVPPTTYKANVETQLAQLNALLTKPCVHILVHQQGRAAPASPTYPWSAYGEMLRQIADEQPGKVAFINADAAFAQTGYPTSDPWDMLSGDDVHMNDSGYKALADVILARLRLGTPRAPQWRVLDGALRANGAIGSADTAQPWTALSGTWTIASNRITCSAAGTVVAPCGLFDQDVSARVYFPVTGHGGVVARCIDDNNRFGIFYNQTTSTATFYVMIGGVNTAYGTLTLATALGGSRVLRIVCSGSRCTGWVDGNLVGSYTLSAGEMTTFAGATRVGLRTSAGAPTYDSFAARAA